MNVPAFLASVLASEDGISLPSWVGGFLLFVLVCSCVTFFFRFVFGVFKFFSDEKENEK